MAPEVSVIVPVYNAEAYLAECLESLLNQTLKELEVICIDDGSTDASMKILRDYAARDERVTVLEQHHGGAGEARNKGMDAAAGEYLFFVDSDDKVETNHIGDLLEEAKQTDADIILTQRLGWWGKKERIQLKNKVRKENLIPEKLFNRQTQQRYILNCCDGGPGGKLFRRALVNEYGLRYPDLPRSEDLVFIYGVLLRARKIYLSDKDGYLYRQNNENSLESTKDRTPLAFWDAYMMLKADIQRLDCFEELKQSFANALIDAFYYNFSVIKTGTGWQAIYDLFLQVKDSELELYAHEDEWYIDLDKLYMLRRIAQAESAIDYLYAQLRSGDRVSEVVKICNSTTFRVGKAVMFIPQLIKSLIKKILGKA